MRKWPGQTTQATPGARSDRQVSRRTTRESSPDRVAPPRTPEGRFSAYGHSTLAEAVERATGSRVVLLRGVARLVLAIDALVPPRLRRRWSWRLVVGDSPPPTTRSLLTRGLLAYSAAITAIGVGVAARILPGPSALAAATGSSAGHASLASDGHSWRYERRTTPPPGPNVATLAQPPPAVGAASLTDPSSTIAVPASPTTTPLGYVNPLAKVTNLQPKRIDQGVDYSGSGPLLALGNGIIKMTSEGGWPGGTFIALQLASGQFAGRVVYYAENITSTVKVGQHVNAGDVVGILHDSFPNLEIGWGGGGTVGGTLGDALARVDGGDFEGVSSAVGVNFSQLLAFLGAPPGIQQGLVGHLPG